MRPENDSNCPKCGKPIPENAPQGLCPACVLAGAAHHSTVSGGVPSQPPSIPEVAEKFPELEVIELIGAGGMGAVYKARQPQLDRFVALKILSHNLSEDPAFVERFNREAKVLARLSHPNIVGVHDFGTAGPYCYLLMEYVDGVNLRQAMQTGGFSPTESLALVEDVCSALKFAHEEGILHRDIKPENILIDSKGRVKIADFGIAKLVGEDRQHDVTLTMRGSILGSPHYMAPEQIETPGDVDQRADIYSLGVVLYEMLTGELPIGRFALPSEKASMDARIDQIVLRTLEKERSARYQSAGEVGTEVGAVTKHPAPTPAKTSPAAKVTGAARFSLTSALLTGSGVILTGLFLAFWVMTISGPVELPGELTSSISAGLLIAIVNILAAAGTSLGGFILGIVALADIRRSGGVKTGLVGAIFAIVVWPIIVLFALGVVFLRYPIIAADRSMSSLVNVVLVLLPVIVASWLLVRSLYRWAGGVERKDGSRFHPGLGIPLLIVMLLTICGPVVMTGAANLLPSGQRSGPEAVNLDIEQIDWHRGGPELTVPIKVHPAYRAEIRLLQTDGKGNTQEIVNIGTWVPSSSPDRQVTMAEIDKCYLAIGTAKPREDDSEGRLGVTAQIRGNGVSGTLHSEADFAEWRFEVPNTLIALTNDQLYSYRIANHERAVEDKKTELAGALYLQVQLIERQP